MIWQTFLLWLLAIHSSHYFFSLSSRLSKKLSGNSEVCEWEMWSVVIQTPGGLLLGSTPALSLPPHSPFPQSQGPRLYILSFYKRFSNIYIFFTHFFKVMSFSLCDCRKECLKEYAAVPGTSTLPIVRPTTATNCQEDFSTSPTTTVHKVENQYSTLSINNSNSNITSTSHSRLSRTSLSPTQVIKDTFSFHITEGYKNISCRDRRAASIGWKCISLKTTLLKIIQI